MDEIVDIADNEIARAKANYVLTVLVETMVPVIGKDRMREIFNRSMERVKLCSEHQGSHPISEYLEHFTHVVQDDGNLEEQVLLGAALLVVVETL